MKWISLTYLITALLIGCTPDNNNSDLFPPISLKDPLEETYDLSTTAEKPYHYYLMLQTSNELYKVITETKFNTEHILNLAEDNFKIALIFMRFHKKLKSKKDNPAAKKSQLIPIHYLLNISDMASHLITHIGLK